MSRSILLTLGTPLGQTLGPTFNLTTDVGSVTPSTASKIELITGKVVVVDDLALSVTITSTGVCTNAITQTIPCGGITTTTTTSTTSTTTTTAAPGPDYQSGSYNSGFSAFGSGSFTRAVQGLGGCNENNWSYIPTNFGGASGVDTYTLYTGSIQLTSGSSFRPNYLTSEGITVPPIIFVPLDSNFTCGQSRLFVTKIESGVSSSIAMLPNTSIPILNGGKVEFWYQAAGGAARPQLYAITGSSFTQTSIDYQTYKIIHTFTSSANFYYNTFTSP
jgi:hypothetical protein